MFENDNTIKIGDTYYLLGEQVKLDASNLEIGEFYIEHTQVNPDRYEIFQKDHDTETIENSWKILGQSENTLKGIALFCL